MTDLFFLRAKVDEIDAEIAKLLSTRLKITDEIGREKIRDGLALEHDLAREKEIICNVSKDSESVDSMFIEELYGLIFEEAVRRQTSTTSKLEK